MSCLLPILFVILAPDPCAVWQDMQAAWWKRETMWRFQRYTRDYEYIPRKLEDIGRLRVVQEPQPFPCGVHVCAGTYNPFLREIRYWDLHALAHELDHLARHAWTEPEGDYRAIGHGTEDDPYRIALAAWHAWMYRDGPYGDFSQSCAVVEAFEQ